MSPGLWGEKTIDALDANGLVKAYVFSMEGKMTAGAFGLGIMGEGPFNFIMPPRQTNFITWKRVWK